MQFLMKSGTLYGSEGSILCTLQKILFHMEKKVYSSDGTLALEISMERTGGPPEKQGDVRFHRYVMKEPDGQQIAVANPGYCPGEDPDIALWPVCRMPRADRACLQLRDRDYTLTMLNSQNYILKDTEGQTVLQIVHRGIIGGWIIDTDLPERPEVFCGLFVFCRYLEQENELMIV